MSEKGQFIKSKKSFTQQEVDLTSTPLFFPEGFEKVFLAIYVIVLPYIAGLLFLFFYIADAKTELFLSLNDDSSFIKSAISFSVKNKDKKHKFVRP
jgi:hypothetical protein